MCSCKPESVQAETGNVSPQLVTERLLHSVVNDPISKTLNCFLFTPLYSRQTKSK